MPAPLAAAAFDGAHGTHEISFNTQVDLLRAMYASKRCPAALGHHYLGLTQGACSEVAHGLAYASYRRVARCWTALEFGVLAS